MDKSNMNQDFLKLIVEICTNISNGNLSLDQKSSDALKSYKKRIHEVANRHTPLASRKKLVQRGGFLPLILSTIGGALLSHLLSKL